MDLFTRWLLIGLLGFPAVTVATGRRDVPLNPSPAGRYQLVHGGGEGGMLHLLDTVTGEVRSFVHGPESAIRDTLKQLKRYGDIIYVEVSQKPGWQDIEVR